MASYFTIWKRHIAILGYRNQNNLPIISMSHFVFFNQNDASHAESKRFVYDCMEKETSKFFGGASMRYTAYRTH